MLGKAYLRTGQLEQAVEAVRQGLDQSNKIGEHYYTAELLRLRGEIELSQGVDLQVAEASFREAIAFAQGQAAGCWERKATERMAQLLLRFEGDGKLRATPTPCEIGRASCRDRVCQY